MVGERIWSNTDVITAKTKIPPMLVSVLKVKPNHQRTDWFRSVWIQPRRQQTEGENQEKTRLTFAGLKYNE